MATQAHNPNYKRFVALIDHDHVERMDALCERMGGVSFGVALEILIDHGQLPPGEILEQLGNQYKARHQSSRRSAERAARALAKLTPEERNKALQLANSMS
jgi:predicted HD phosphohydrolase